MFILLGADYRAYVHTVITLTEGLRRELSEEYDIARRSRITVPPLGLDLDAFARVPRVNPATFAAPTASRRTRPADRHRRAARAHQES